MPPANWHRYRAFGLGIASEFPLDPYLEPASETSADADLVVAWHTVAAQRTADSLDAEFPGLLRVHLRGGRHVWLDPIGGLSTAGVAEMTCGPVLAMALAQRGLFVLHAAAVERDGVALAVSGHSGSGKSTAAALWASRGGRLLSDDIVPLDPAAGRVEAVAGPTLAKLSEVPAVADGHVHPVGVEVMGGKQLCRWTRMGAPGERVPLAAVLLIEDGPRPAVEPLRGQAAIAGLLRFAFCLPVVGARRQAAQLVVAAAVAAGVPVVRLARPRTPDGALASLDLAWEWVVAGRRRTG